MPLLPIDLQTMFNQMSQVGRETAVQREVSSQYQLLQGAEIVRRTEEDDHAVPQAREVGEGLEKIREERQRRQPRRRSNEDQEHPGERGEKKDDSLFEDPDLGHHVDLVG
jgi:hypothetical protein